MCAIGETVGSYKVENNNLDVRERERERERERVQEAMIWSYMMLKSTINKI
jgi:hypothetical protein